jgi:murein DD-endopeptidase MepM/ murein hydrolase activator NlpD
MSESPPDLRSSASHDRPVLPQIALAAAVLGVGLLLWHTLQPTPVAPSMPAPLASATMPPPAISPTAVHAPPQIQPQQASLAATIEVIVGRNDTLDRIFRRMALDTADLARIRDLPGIRQSLDFLRPGDAIEVTHTDGEIRTLTRKVSETQTLKVVRDASGFAVQMIEHPVELHPHTATARIDSSLFESAASAGMSEQLALELANIFAWDIDFVLDIRDGDRFTVVYNQVFQDGRYLHDGDILAAEFVNDGKVYRAVRYVSPAGVSGYYTPQGLPMRKAFLRTPVEFTRISSRFNPHRHHPILNLIRGHMGTDYAAPVGTPVRAASDGRVSFKGRKGGYGNALMLAHTRGVSTLYGHLSRYAKNLRTGDRVHQGQVIAFVGMTGLATGPHLHYEYLMNGVHKDPEKVQLPAAEPLSADALQIFQAQCAPLLERLRQPVSVAKTAN